MIYKDKLENKQLSVETFRELERRFPENKYRMDYYFQSYLMGLRYKDKPLETEYKNKLIQIFPESDYAKAVADPNYEYNIRMMDRVQDSLYETTYNRYLANDTSFVRRGYRHFSKTYPLATLMPKFMFIEALTYVQSGDAAGFKTALQKLVEKYPSADVTELANEMLKGILRGRKLVQGNMTGMKWNLRFGLDEYGQLSAADSARQFIDNPQSPHRMVLLYPTGAVDRNQLLYAVAAYNFAHFEVKSFDLSMEEAGSFSMLIVSGFNNLEETLEYYAMIYAPEGYASAIDRAVSFFPFSDENYETLLHGKTLEEYMTFFAERYGAQAPELVARWRMQVAADAEETSREDIAVEQAADVSTENFETTEEKKSPQKEIKEEISEETPLSQQEKAQEAGETSIEKEQEPVKEATEETEHEEKNIPEGEEQTVSPDTTVTSQDSVLVKPKEITLEYLQKRRAQAEAKERLEQEAKEKTLEERRKEAAKQKKQLLKEREALRRQKAKEAKERLKQKEKERKEKEKANRQRQKEKEAARKAAQKEKAATRKARTRK